MRTRGHSRTGAAALVGLAILTVGAAAPALAAERPQPQTERQTGPGEKGSTKPAPDRTAPERPALGEVRTEPGGTVELPVQAERGSALVVREGADAVASAAALGDTQTLSWETTSGPHTYLVVATDAAGNVSDSASFTIDVDATPPRVGRFVVKPGTARDTRSRWGVITDPGTAYRLVVDGNTLAEGTTEARVTRQNLDLADGTHKVRLELSDEAGNVSTVNETVSVEIPELWVAAKDVSADNATERTFRIASAPGTRGFLRVPGGGQMRFQLPNGRAEVTLDVPEGSYDAPVVIVADDRDRKGTTELAPFAVDRTAPALQVTTDEAQADRGVLAAAITAGAGDTVLWRLVDDRGIAILSGQYVANGAEQRLDREVAEGRYQLEVTATDAMGNEANESVTTGVTARPMINPDVLPVLRIVLVLWLVVAAAFYLRRHSGRRSARAAARQQALVEYERQLETFERAEQAWRQRRDALAQLVSVANGGEVALPPGAPALRPHERPFCDLPARLVEMRLRNGAEVPVEVEAGRLVITDRRVTFVGSKQRDWELAKIEQLRHGGAELTLLKVSNRKTVSGVAYAEADADLVRLYLELAIAAANGDTGSMRVMLEQGVRSHELRRPLPPAPVWPAPIGPAPVGAPVEAPVAAPVAAPVVPVAAAPEVVAQTERSAERELVLRG